MSNALKFKVGIDGLEKEIYRVLEISDNNTVADLAYTILASFDSLAYHLYNIKHGKNTYICYEDELNESQKSNFAYDVKLKELDFLNNKMTMEYDFGSPTTFQITYIDSKIIERGKGKHYPYILEGKGRGMMDDICDFDLKKIVEETKKLGYSKFDYTPGYERKIKYDYRNYDIKVDNALLKGDIAAIKENYESELMKK